MYGNLKRGEDTEQMAVIDWAGWNTGRFPELKLLFHIPNGGKRDAREAARFKAMGVRAGVPDLCLPVPMNGFAGLYIEMKYGTNKPTAKQNEWIKALKKQGYKVVICYGAIEAEDELENYLSGGHTILTDPKASSARPQKRIEIYCSSRDRKRINDALIKGMYQTGRCPFGSDFITEDCNDAKDSESCESCVLKNISFVEYE